MKIGQRFNPHRMFTGVFIPDSVYSYPRLSAVAKLIYGRLCKYKGERGDAYPSACTLAEELGISDRQVFEHLGKLVEEGFIDREPRPGTSTVYHFLWHPCFEDDYEVVRKTALPPQIGVCGNPHGGHEETRTTGHEEILTRSESIEKSQGRESETPIVPFQEKSKTEDLGSLEYYREESAFDAIQLMKGEVGKSKWPKRPKKPEDPNSASARLRRLREAADSQTETGSGSNVMTFPVPNGTTDSLPRSTAPEIDLRNSLPGRWNKIVTDAPIEWHPAIDQASDRRLKILCLDPAFLEKFDEVATVCQAMRKNGNEFVSFPWMLKAKEGTENWRRVLGELRWMATPKKAAKEESFMDKMFREKNERDAKKKGIDE